MGNKNELKLAAAIMAFLGTLLFTFSGTVKECTGEKLTKPAKEAIKETEKRK